MTTIIDDVPYTVSGGYDDMDFEALGGVYTTPPRTRAGGCRLGRIGPQQCFVDSLGKVFIVRGLFGISSSLHNHTLGGGQQAGRTYPKTRAEKYPNDGGTTWEQATKHKLERCHFNTAGPFSADVGLPSIGHSSPSMNARRKDRSAAFYGLADPIKDIARCMVTNPPGNAQLFYRPSGSSSSVGWPDVLDPNWAKVCAQSFGQAGIPAVGFAFEESDYMSRWLSHGHPNERGGALSTGHFNGLWGIHLGMGILFSRLVVTQAHTPKNELVTFTDTTNYSKAWFIQFLKDKYGTIAALNAAWQTGGYYTSFDPDGGWGVGTGVADEDGLRPRTWFGSQSPVYKGHFAGQNNVVDSTSWAPAVKVDADAMMLKSVEAWVKPVWDTLKTRDPGLPFAMVNNAGFPMRPVLAPLWNKYNDFFMGSPISGRVGFSGAATLKEATDHMNWVYPLVPKPYISNFYIGAPSADSCVHYLPASGGAIGANVTQGLAIYERLIKMVMPFRVAGLNVFPHVGWMRWEFSDNPGESGWPHWGIISLNDGLHGGWDFTFPQADPWAPDRQIATEDFHYSDMLGFGGTIPPVLVRRDLIVGANIDIKAVIKNNMAGIVLPGPTPTPTPEPEPEPEPMPDPTPALAFPSVIDRAATNPGVLASTALMVPIPPGDPGQVLLAAVMKWRNPEPFVWPKAADGTELWTPFVADFDPIRVRLEIRTRVADGSEGASLTVGASAVGGQSKTRVWRIKNFTGLAVKVVRATSLSPHAPLLLPPWGTNKTLWIVIGAWNGFPTITLPVDYGQVYQSGFVGNGGWCRLVSAEREHLIDQESPGVIATDRIESYIIATIGIAPVPAEAPVPDPDPEPEPEPEPVDAADVVEVTVVQGEINPGDPVQAVIRMKNAGTASWTAADGYTLRAIEPAWSAPHTLVPSITVEPGAEHSFTFSAPFDVPLGATPFRWRMAKGDVFFGPEASAVIQVTPEPEPEPEPGPDPLATRVGALETKVQEMMLILADADLPGDEARLKAIEVWRRS